VVTPRPIAITLALLATACGGSPGAGASGPPHDEPPVACGAHVREIQGRRCAVDGEACPVLDGTCACDETITYAPHCGGAAYEPMQSVGPPTWQCTPTDPTSDRGDGCPFSPPLDGTMCPRPDVSCSYGGPDGCGNFAGAVAQCSAGHWAVEVSLPLPYP
jgi:hypothetical protein